MFCIYARVHPIKLYTPYNICATCCFLAFLICIVAETNKHPFDLPDAETELVSGFNVEYCAMRFALFSLG
jgi:NADH:ubiquinone oxidoreductase subunit H